MCVGKCVHMIVSVYFCMGICINMYMLFMCMYVRRYIYIYIFMYVCVCLCICINVRMCICLT